MTRHPVSSYSVDVEKCVHFILQHPCTPAHAKEMLRKHVADKNSWPSLDNLDSTGAVKVAYSKLDYIMTLCRGIFAAHLNHKGGEFESHHTSAYLRLVERHTSQAVPTKTFKK